MTDVTILGVTFHNIDFLELETNSAFYAGMSKIQNITNSTTTRNSVTALIVEASNVASQWADDVLGEGAGEKIFKGKKSLSIVMEVMKALSVANAQAYADFLDEATSIGDSVEAIKTKMNREQRREQERQKHRNGRKKNGRKNSHYQTSPAPEPLHVVPEPYAPEPQPAPEQTE